jgi:hypothetical protein
MVPVPADVSYLPHDHCALASRPKSNLIGTRSGRPVDSQHVTSVRDASPSRACASDPKKEQPQTRRHPTAPDPASTPCASDPFRATPQTMNSLHIAIGFFFFFFSFSFLFTFFFLTQMRPRPGGFGTFRTFSLFDVSQPAASPSFEPTLTQIPTTTTPNLSDLTDSDPAQTEPVHLLKAPSIDYIRREEVLNLICHSDLFWYQGFTVPSEV